jgi:acyl-coenzyme A synthetase/AMP-(fatty) acid ligase/acyl carrier protein
VLAQDATTDPARFADYMKRNVVDVLKITPNHLAALTAGRAGGDLASVLPKKWVILGGEALRPDVARTLLGVGTCRVLNHYGPTETTVGVCTFEVTTDSLERVLAVGAQTIPVGTPLANTRAYIVDTNDNQMPIGIPGELVIGGAGVAQGYFNRDDLTAERFMDLAGDRVYRTGDRARRLPDGSIEFLGRADDQVKVRGYRVELGEIEQVLRGHSGVANNTVMLRTDEETEPRLVAYVVAKQAGYEVAHAERLSGDALREWLATQLPEYMVPSAVVLLDAIPLTANGKIDRTRLPQPGGDAMSAGQQYVAPRSDIEVQLAAIWVEVLKKERVGATDNFLDLGGHSLMAIRVLGKISKTFGVRLPLRTLFDSPTVEQLAVVVAAEKATAAPVAAIGARSRDAFRIGTDGGTK